MMVREDISPKFRMILTYKSTTRSRFLTYVVIFSFLSLKEKIEVLLLSFIEMRKQSYYSKLHAYIYIKYGPIPYILTSHKQ